MLSNSLRKHERFAEIEERCADEFGMIGSPDKFTTLFCVKPVSIATAARVAQPLSTFIVQVIDGRIECARRTAEG